MLTYIYTRKNITTTKIMNISITYSPNFLMLLYNPTFCPFLLPSQETIDLPSAISHKFAIPRNLYK